MIQLLTEFVTVLFNGEHVHLLFKTWI